VTLYKFAATFTSSYNQGIYVNFYKSLPHNEINYYDYASRAVAQTRTMALDVNIELERNEQLASGRSQQVPTRSQFLSLWKLSAISAVFNVTV